MIPYIQTDIEHGNCWQTAIASILEVEPSTLPCQVTIEKAGTSYWNSINSYLMDHHGLVYSEICDYQFTGLVPCHSWFNGYHLLVGPTVRTPHNGCKHVVVARFGVYWFDPHPSEAGLTEVEKWGVLGKANNDQLERRKWSRSEHCKYPDASMWCLCPACCEDPVKFIADTKERYEAFRAKENE